MQKILSAALIGLIAIAVIVTATNIMEYTAKVERMESKIETLQESNATLQQERDELYTEYVGVRDELWNLKNGMANN
jgi:predicted nuclease with TOPRIM domain